MSDDQPPQDGMGGGAALEIPAPARFWDELIHLREDQRALYEEFQQHCLAVAERHRNMGAQLATLAAVAEANTAARESYDFVVRQLFSVMRQWYHTGLDQQRLLILIAEKLEIGGLASTIEPPVRPMAPLAEREHGRA